MTIYLLQGPEKVKLQKQLCMQKEGQSPERESTLVKTHNNLPAFCSEYVHFIRVNAKEMSVILCDKHNQRTSCRCLCPALLQPGRVPGDCSPFPELPAGITTALGLWKAERK